MTLPSLDFIVQCLGCLMVKTELTEKKPCWVPYTEYPAYGYYLNHNRISHGYCLTCADRYLEQQGVPRDEIIKILRDHE